MATCGKSFLTKVVYSWLSEVRSVKLLSWDQSQDTIKRAIYHSRWKYWLIDVLLVVSTGMYTKLALIVHFKWNACKKINVTAKISCYGILSAVSYSLVVTLKLHKQYLNTVIYNTTILLRIKTEQFGYRTLFNVNIYESYKLSKNSPFFGPPCTWTPCLYRTAAASQAKFQLWLFYSLPAWRQISLSVTLGDFTFWISLSLSPKFGLSPNKKIHFTFWLNFHSVRILDWVKDWSKKWSRPLY